MRLTLAIGCASACFLFGLAAANSAERVNPGHALAQKFAIDDTMPAPKPSAVKPSQPVFQAAPKPGADYENEMLEAARSEAAARASTSTVVVNPSPQSAPAPTAALPALTLAPTAAPTAKPAVAGSNSVANPARHAANDPVPAPSATAEGAGQHITVLLVLTSADKTTSNGKVQSNPILCAADDCYIGTGSASPAKMMPRAEAMAAKNSALGLPGTCQGFAYCVFRDIALKPGASLQVIDAGFARSEPYEAFDAKPDKTCVVEDGDLDCQQPVTAKDYRLWLVPEQVAQTSKPAQIEDALSTGLVEENVTRADDK